MPFGARHTLLYSHRVKPILFVIHFNPAAQSFTNRRPL
jgi:hypothetical protein